MIFAVRGSSRSTAAAIVDLPQPDSPARPSVWPASQGQADAADGRHVTAGGPVRDGQIAQLDQGHQRSRSLGSSTLSSACPHNVKPSTTMMIATPGAISHH